MTVKDPVMLTMLEAVLERYEPGMRLACGRVVEGKAVVHLLERTGHGWWNVTTAEPCVTTMILDTYDDMIVAAGT